MTMFVSRYDLRCPAGTPAERGALYRTALDQAAWCEDHSFDTLVLSEHHGVDDGYLPSPLVMAAAFAGRTKTIPITISALLAPLYDPLRLAEDIAVLDHASGGRVSYVMGLGYREEEYAAFDRDWPGRGALIEEVLETLLQAWSGEPFDYRGRSVRVTPTPLNQPHPMIFYGGGSKVAARRAARLGLSFFPQHADPAIQQAYLDECVALGIPPGMVLAPPEGPGTIYCAEDPDAFWDQAGEHLLYEARAYHAWQKGVTSAVHDESSSVEEMRAAGIYVVWTPEEMIERCRGGELMAATTHPLCGGMPPELSWVSLRLIGETVIPAVKG
jgi:alkanesulfonate monooxygenase SsuD/methylene tetrahydromethanopterin reductase-like flavin-dependent oxidoreductase (luciferase family)